MNGGASTAAQDAEPLPPDIKLLRRIPARRVKLTPDGPIPDSDNFSDEDGEGTSVDVWETAEAPALALAGHDGFYLVWFTVGDVEAAGLTVRRDPLPNNPHHALIIGPRNRTKQRRVAAACLNRWIDAAGAPAPPQSGIDASITRSCEHDYR